MDYKRTFLLNINALACGKAEICHSCSGICTLLSHCAESLGCNNI